MLEQEYKVFSELPYFLISFLDPAHTLLVQHGSNLLCSGSSLTLEQETMESGNLYGHFPPPQPITGGKLEPKKAVSTLQQYTSVFPIQKHNMLCCATCILNPTC